MCRLVVWVSTAWSLQKGRLGGDKILGTDDRKTQNNVKIKIILFRIDPYCTYILYIIVHDFVLIKFSHECDDCILLLS